MRFRYVLTWKRGTKLLPRWVIVTFPLVVTLVVGSIVGVPPPLAVSPGAVFVIGVILSVVLCTINYRFTRFAGEVLYYPPLHQPGWLGLSTAAVELTGIGLTYLTYLLFIVPYNQPYLPPLQDLGVGVVLATGYALFLNGWKTHVIRGDKDPVAETESAEQIRTSLQQLRGDDPRFEATEQLIAGLQDLAEEYEEEPLLEQSSTPDALRIWCSTCAASTSLTSRLRMIPATGKSPTTERTEQQVSRFREIENDLHVLDIIASTGD